METRAAEARRDMVGVEFPGQTHKPNRDAKENVSNALSETSAFQHLMSSELDSFPDLFRHRAPKIFHCFKRGGC